VQLNQRVSKMGVAADADELTPQGKTATRRVFKRKIREDDSDISEFTPDF
jgi:U3 small nucleolar ribonucleoprotein component